MTAQIIDGTAVAARLRGQLAAEVSDLAARHGRVPGFAMVLVGEDPASEVYVRSKGKATVAAGMRAFEHKLDAAVPEAELLALVARLNADVAVDGILVQLPLPAHISSERVLAAIDPAKDVDGFHPINVGRLALGQDGLAPCTPTGCMILLREVVPDPTGLHAVVIGRSNLVGRPVSQLLLKADCTVTIAHSKTRDLPAICRSADILVAAAGRAELVRGDWVKPGAVVIDVGINRVAGPEGKARLVGDVATAEVMERARAVTPVPGGVGPMTIACLLQNTVAAYRARLARGVTG